MEFSPANPIVKRCIQGMSLEESGQAQEAAGIFRQAWNEATNDFEKYLAAYYVARQQNNTSDQLQWLETTLQLARRINDEAVQSAFSPLYEKIGNCYEALNRPELAKEYFALAKQVPQALSDKGPFFHGTRADLPIGALLTAKNRSNYNSDIIMNHIYFTALPQGASLAAALAQGTGAERVYMVEPTGSFENDPNVTNKKFPGNPTRSYRTEAPLKIIGEATDWAKQDPDEIKKWREKLASNKGDIIN